MDAEKAVRSPTTDRRISLVCNFLTSRLSAIRNSSISALTSASGRRQFSLEKANSVRVWIPRSAARRITARTASTPAWWPRTPDRPRARAQRLLPSMMMATCCGNPSPDGLGGIWEAVVCADVMVSRTGVGKPGGISGAARQGSDLHQVVFLHFELLVDLGNMLVGQLLNHLFGTMLLIFGDLLLLEQCLDVVIGITPHVADCHTSVFSFAPGLFDIALACLFGEHRHRHTNDITGTRGVQPQVGGHDRLFNLGHHVLLPRHHRKGAGILDIHRSHLIEWHIATVVLHGYRIENAGVGTPSTNLVEITMQSLKALLHPAFCIFLDVIDHVINLCQSACLPCRPLPGSAGRRACSC